MNTMTENLNIRERCATAELGVLTQSLVDFLASRLGQRYSEARLAERFGTKANRVRQALAPACERGEVCLALEGSMRLYFAPGCVAGRPESTWRRGDLSGYETHLRKMSELRMQARGAGWRL